MEGVAAITIAIACGISAVSKEFIPFFFGPGYEPCIDLTVVFTPILLFKGFSVIIRTQYLIPMKMEKDFTKSVIIGAIVNMILNCVLIPSYGALGATIATVIAELAACVLQFIPLRGKELDIKQLFIKTLFYLCIGLAMIIVVRLAANIPVNTVIKLLIEIAVGILLYGSICLIYWIKTNNRFYEILCKPIIVKLHLGK